MNSHSSLAHWPYLISRHLILFDTIKSCFRVNKVFVLSVYSPCAWLTLMLNRTTRVLHYFVCKRRTVTAKCFVQFGVLLTWTRASSHDRECTNSLLRALSGKGLNFFPCLPMVWIAARFAIELMNRTPLKRRSRQNIFTRALLGLKRTLFYGSTSPFKHPSGILEIFSKSQ